MFIISLHFVPLKSSIKLHHYFCFEKRGGNGLRKEEWKERGRGSSWVAGRVGEPKEREFKTEVNEGERKSDYVGKKMRLEPTGFKMSDFF